MLNHFSIHLQYRTDWIIHNRRNAQQRERRKKCWNIICIFDFSSRKSLNTRPKRGFSVRYKPISQYIRLNEKYLVDLFSLVTWSILSIRGVWRSLFFVLMEGILLYWWKQKWRSHDRHERVCKRSDLDYGWIFNGKWSRYYSRSLFSLGISVKVCFSLIFIPAYKLHFNGNQL